MVAGENLHEMEFWLAATTLENAAFGLSSGKLARWWLGTLDM